MITIVLADDEKLIRAGLKKILLDSIDFPLEIIEAKNGQEALDFCKEKRPEILITDIRMPVMDGVELMKNISQMEDDYKPAIIVLSGYDDFSYAKAAIQSGALSYILKPVDKKELCAAVNSAIMNSLNEEKKQNEVKFRQIIEKGRLEDVSGLPEITVENGLRCIIICGKNSMQALESVMQGRRYYVVEHTKNSVLIVYPFDGRQVEYEPSYLDSYIVGISGPADDYSMLRTMRRQAMTAAMQAFFDSESGMPLQGKKNGGLYYWENANHISDFTQLDETYEKVISHCDLVDAEEIQGDVTKLFDCFDENAVLNSETLYYLYRKITSNLFTKYPGYTDSDMYLHIKSIMIENIFEYSDLAEWQGSVTDYVVYLSALLKQNTKESPYITEALDFIKSHFKKNINMAMVANQVSVNYTWFSEKFKEHTGLNFNEYLKRLRIDEAKKLLEKGTFKVYEVSERSGFSDVKYFMKIFREETGMSPTEWSKKHES